MEKISLKHIGQQWEQRSLLLLQISLWLETVLTVSTLVKTTKKLLNKSAKSQSGGKSI